MIPLRLVLDTNIVVSAALKPNGLQRTALVVAITKPARWYLTDEILSEYAAVLSRPELKIRRGVRQQFLTLIKNRAYRVSPTHLPQVTSDPADQAFIECSDAARADYLVTGNSRHFPKFWKKTKIVSAREVLDVVTPFLIE